MRNNGLDCLRGLAILLVISNHIGIRIGLSHTAAAEFLPRWFLVAINYNGGEAVTIFFVLSGFLIASSLLQRFGSLQDVRPLQFILHRAARILPCLLALLVVMGALDWACVPDYTFSKPGQSFLGASMAAIGLYFNVWQARHGWSVAGLTVLWSLSIEELFYLGFPFLCRLPRKWMVAILIILAISVPFYHSSLHGNEIWRDQATLTGMGTIAAGVLAAITSKYFRVSGLPAVVFGCTGICLMLVELLAPASWWKAVGDTLLASLILGTVMIVLACHWRPPQASIFSWWLPRMGQLSYEIYLTHMFVVMAAVRLFHAYGCPIADGWLVYPLSFLLIWILGEGVSRFYSFPIARFLDQRLARWHRPALFNGA